MDATRHSHTFGQDRKRPGESRTIIVVAITTVMMVVEIATGMLFGSMALLADGLHMASHTAALSISLFAYIYARRYAHDVRFSFGTGKVNALGGFSGAVLLAVFAVMMAVESLVRLANPVTIAFNQAIFVAALGLVVNGLSIVVLDHKAPYQHDHGQPAKADDADHPNHDHHQDHTLRSAYLHVLADALTSLLAIFALLAAKYTGLIWMDPLMGIVGAAMVSRWSIDLLVSSSHMLLDRQAPSELQEKIVERIEKNSENHVIDLHLWAVGPDIYAAIVSVASEIPKPPEDYKRLIPKYLNVVHVTVEVNPTRS